MISSIIRIRHPEPHPAAPWADHTLTSIMFFFLGVVLYMGRTMPAGYVPEFLTNIGLTTLAIPLCKRVFGSLAPFIGTKEAVSKPRNTRKFCDQSWQLVVHVAMTLYELRILGRAETAWTWWNNPGGENGCWTPDPPQASDDQLRSFYLMQLGIWFYTAFSCRFVESRHKDYFVMYTHHIVTIMLVGISFAQGTLRIGLLVLLIHDASDIVADLLKMANYMGLDEKSGLYLTEILFVGNLVSWIWLRLWLYPSHVIMTVWRDTERFYNPPSGFNTAAHVGIFACWAFLSVLFLMHIYWFCLFVRIAVRLLKASEDAHQAGAAEYEGGSEDESSGGEEEEEVKKKKK